jgi:hypothetical protein
VTCFEVIGRERKRKNGFKFCFVGKNHWILVGCEIRGKGMCICDLGSGLFLGWRWYFLFNWEDCGA